MYTVSFYKVIEILVSVDSVSRQSPLTVNKISTTIIFISYCYIIIKNLSYISYSLFCFETENMLFYDFWLVSRQWKSCMIQTVRIIYRTENI